MTHPSRGGDVLEENEIVAHFPDIGLGLDKPDFLFCLTGAPAMVVEAKNEAGKLDQAITEAIAYAETINATGRHDVRIAVGAAGEEDAGFLVEVRFRTSSGWAPLTSYGFELTTIPSEREAELALASADGTTQVTVPASQEFIDAAIELSSILRAAKVEAPLRPKVIGAMVMAMYEGPIDTRAEHALASVNGHAEAAINATTDMTSDRKKQLVDALRLSGADFDRLAPSIGRVVSILRRLNVRSVIQTDTDFLGMFYEAFLRYGYDNNALGIVFTPRHITRFCVELLGATPADRVIDIASGTGGFLVAAFDRMMAAATGRGAPTVAKVKESLWGFDTNPTVWALSMVNMFVRGDGRSNMELGSCFTESSRKAVKRRFTRAFLNPPFSQEGEPERDFIDAAVEALEPDGLAAAVIYAGVFADDDHKAWRKEFTRRHSLVAMISLPEDLFYPTAAPTTIIVAQAHVPQRDDDDVLMARVWNDGFEKLKNRRIERAGSQLPEIKRVFDAARSGKSFTSDIATTVKGKQVKDGAEWSPQQWLPQPHVSAAELVLHEETVLRATFRAVASLPDLADEALPDFGEAWEDMPDLPTGKSGPVSDFFVVAMGRSTGEKNYADGTTPYVSSGDATNSIIRLVAPVGDELIVDGGISVTAFGTAAVQPWPFMGRGNGGSAVRVLTPRYNMSVRELLWFAAQINVQRWRFLYARMAIKSRLARLVVESPPTRLADTGDPLADRLVSFRDSLNAFAML
jgi:hypothetical protein